MASQESDNMELTLDEMNSQMFSSSNMSMMAQLPQLMVESSTPSQGVQPTTSTMVGAQQSMPPPPPVRFMDYNVGQMTTMSQQQQMVVPQQQMVVPQQSMPPPPPVRFMNYNAGQMTTMPQQQQLKQEYLVTETAMPPPPPLRSMDYNVGQMTTMSQQQQVKQEYPVTETPMPQQPQQLKQEYSATDYQWNYSIQVQQPSTSQSIIEDDRVHYPMRGLPTANSFNKPPHGFKSKVKIFISHIRTLLPSVDEGFLALLNVIDQNHYGVSMPDNDEYIFVHFNDNLDLHFKRKFIDYAVDGKVF